MFGTALTDSAESVNLVQYGNPGSGKTTSAAFAAHLGPVAYLAVEPGIKKGPLQRLGVPLDKIKLERPITAKQFSACLDEVIRYGDKVTSTVLDTLTEGTNRWYEDYRDARIGKLVAAAEKRGEATDVDRMSTDVRDWQELVVNARPEIRQFFDLPGHSIVLAHVRRDIDEDTGDVHYGPATSPALQTMVNLYADVLMYLARDAGGIPVGYVEGHTFDARYAMKDRYGLLPSPLAYPTFDRIHGYIQGDLTPKTDAVQRDYEKGRKANAKAESEAR